MAESNISINLVDLADIRQIVSQATTTIGDLSKVLVYIYGKAGLALPEVFNPDVEGPRLVQAIRERRSELLRL